MGAASPGKGEAAPARIWDIPIRVIHWAIVVLIAALWWTAQEHRMDWHRWAGFTLLGLLTFRILWGVFGSSTARFSAFVRGPVTVWRYFRSLIGKGSGETFHGHNPMGAWSVVAMLAVLLFQVGLGLFASDVDGLQSGPFAHHLTFREAREVAGIHATVFDLILVLVSLHVAAVIFYLVVRRENLIGAMFHGRRRQPPTEPEMRPAPLWRFATAALIAAAFTYWISKGAPPF